MLAPFPLPPCWRLVVVGSTRGACPARVYVGRECHSHRSSKQQKRREAPTLPVFNSFVPHPATQLGTPPLPCLAQSVLSHPRHFYPRWMRQCPSLTPGPLCDSSASHRGRQPSQQDALGCGWGCSLLHNRIPSSLRLRDANVSTGTPEVLRRQHTCLDSAPGCPCPRNSCPRNSPCPAPLPGPCPSHDMSTWLAERQKPPPPPRGRSQDPDLLEGGGGGKHAITPCSLQGDHPIEGPSAMVCRGPAP